MFMTAAFAKFNRDLFLMLAWFPAYLAKNRRMIASQIDRPARRQSVSDRVQHREVMNGSMKRTPVTDTPASISLCA